MAEAEKIVLILTLLVVIFVVFVSLLHVFIVDVGAGAQVGFSVGKKVVGTKVNYKIPANVGVCPFEFAGV